MKITYYGHSCFSVQVSDKQILFDPFISGNELAKNIDIEKLWCDYILISHGHRDHILDAVSIGKRTGATIVTNFEIVNWLEKKGLSKTHSMNIGGHWFFDFGKVKCVNAIHSSSLPDGTYGGQAMGFLLETKDGNVYYSGDTALTWDMKLIGAYKKINIALLPIGNNFTMGIDNAIIAADFVNCDKIIGLHYDTFGAIKIDQKEAIDKFRTSGRDLYLLPIGDTMEI